MVECTDKPLDHGKRMSSGQVLDVHKLEHAQGPNTTNLYPANTRVVGHGSKVRKGIIWRWREGKTYYGVPAQVLWGEMSCWDDIPPKRSKDELEPLGACHEG